MKTLEELNTELFRKLRQSPIIEAFFRESLEKRVMCDETWIENSLVMYVLDETFTQDKTLSQWIAILASSPQDYNELQKKLTHNHEYDEKMADVLAEISAYCHIKTSRFTEVHAIPESDGKTPDFSAVLRETKYLFEVKNMRAATDVQDFVRDKITARRLMNPEPYKAIQFHVRVSRAWEEVSFRSAKYASLKLALLYWLQGFFLAIERGEGLDLVSKRRFVDGEKDELWVEYDLKDGPHWITTGFSRGRELEKDRMQELPPFLARAARKVEQAAKQLFEYDDACQFEKYVMLSFPYERSFILLENELQAIIGGLDSIVKNISDKLHLRWLPRDNLP